MKNGTIKRIAAGIFAAAMVLTLVPPIQADAEVILDTSQLTIPIGKVTKKSAWLTEDYYEGYGSGITVYNKSKKDKITYTSSNKKVVTVDKNGWPTGKKAGKANITVKNGKKKIGTVKITVKNTALASSKYGRLDYGLGKQADVPIARFTKPGAKYTLTSNKKGISFSKSSLGINGMYNVNFKKTGTYTVTVKEKINKKTKKLGTVKLTARNIRQDRKSLEYSPFVKGYVYPAEIWSYIPAQDIAYEITNGKDTVITQESDTYSGMDSTYFKVVGEGTATIRATNKKGDKDYGSITFTTVRNKCAKIEIEDDELTTITKDNGTTERGYLLMTGTDYVSKTAKTLDYLANGVGEDDSYTCSDDVVYSSDNPSVFTVSYVDNYKGEYYVGYTGYMMTAVAPGEANVIVKCGDQQTTIPVKVVDFITYYCKSLDYTDDPDRVLTMTGEDGKETKGLELGYDNGPSQFRHGSGWAYGAIELNDWKGVVAKSADTDDVSDYEMQSAIQYTSNNPDIVKVDKCSNYKGEAGEYGDVYTEDDGYYAEGLKPGWGSITAKCGKFTLTFPVHVVQRPANYSEDE